MGKVIDIKTGRPIKRTPLPISYIGPSYDTRMKNILSSLEKINRLMKDLKEEAKKL